MELSIYLLFQGIIVPCLTVGGVFMWLNHTDDAALGLNTSTGGTAPLHFTDTVLEYDKTYHLRHPSRRLLPQ